MSLWKPLERTTHETNKFYRNLAKGIHTGQRKEMSFLYKGLVYVPPTPELRTKVIEAHHNTPLAGHPGIAKTLEAHQSKLLVAFNERSHSTLCENMCCMSTN